MPGDFGSNDGIHRGRLAGTWNFGLGKERDCPVVLLEASGHILSDAVAARLLEKAAPYIDYSPKRKPSASLIEIQEHKYERPSIVDFYLTKVVPLMNPEREHYHQDLFAVGRLFDNGFCEMDVKKVLLEHDPNPIESRKPGREAWFLENIVREVQESQGKKAPQSSPQTPPTVQGGGEVFMSSGGVPAAVPSSIPQPDPATSPEPEQSRKPTGERVTGSITFDADGRPTIAFGTPEAPKATTATTTPTPSKPLRPAQRRSFSLGIKPVAVATSSGPKP